ncbi:hypothetical protein RHGRI_015803 [Rhododendron griersonianum]|uniref:Uncharacterized protein n=1 Tax=Rhododendron griersonianum TaxID=479676 RepID=A0AAV6J542_9ERIC|nr:hypothetical protein RHGRI_022304 [Rhododendron griersonianum]KAG5534659.1 hypothetical protein RHGRI_022698 [Rhododendron griersonianum]KAG5537227.1 hypothetical protein RHGRI_024615 [Rhododendron griersonianum]KAG5542822.1 hypothetical protein RHGRI_015803 [Rhododendron griersonianum]
MGDENPLGDNRRLWYLTHIPTLPGEESEGAIDAVEGTNGRAGWVLYRQLKQEVCTMMRRLHATRDAIKVCEQILSKEPELPLMNYINEQIAQYMASESAWDEEYLANESAMEHVAVQNTTNDLANMVLDGH